MKRVYHATGLDQAQAIAAAGVIEPMVGDRVKRYYRDSHHEAPEAVYANRSPAQRDVAQVMLDWVSVAKRIAGEPYPGLVSDGDIAKYGAVVELDGSTFRPASELPRQPGIEAGDYVSLEPARVTDVYTGERLLDALRSEGGIRGEQYVNPEFLHDMEYKKTKIQSIGARMHGKRGQAILAWLDALPRMQESTEQRARFARMLEAMDDYVYHSTEYDVGEFHPGAHFGSADAAAKRYQDMVSRGDEYEERPFRTYRVKKSAMPRNPAVMKDTGVHHRRVSDLLDGLMWGLAGDSGAQNNFTMEEVRDFYQSLDRLDVEDYGREMGMSPEHIEQDWEELVDSHGYVEASWDHEFGQLSDWLRSRGHDGIAYINTKEDPGSWSYIPLVGVKAESRKAPKTRLSFAETVQLNEMGMSGLEDAYHEAISVLRNELLTNDQPGLVWEFYTRRGEENQTELRDEDREDFAEFVEDMLETLVRSAESALIRHVTHDDQGLHVWREIVAPEGWEQRMDLRGLGEYWSWDEGAAEAHWAGREGEGLEHLIHAVVDPRRVDWVRTLVMNANPEYEEEREIFIPSGTPMRVLGVSREGEPLTLGGRTLLRAGLHERRGLAALVYGEGMERIDELDFPASGKVYHTTPHEFDKFNPLSHFGTTGAADDAFRGKVGHYSIERDTPRAQPWKTYRATLKAERPVLMIDNGEQHDNASDYWQGIEWAWQYGPVDDRDVAGWTFGDMMEEMEKRYGYEVGDFDYDHFDMLGREISDLESVGKYDEAKKVLVDFLKNAGHDSIVYVNAEESAGEWSWVNLDPVTAEALGESRLDELDRPQGGRMYHATKHDVEEFHPLSHFGSAQAASDRYGEFWWNAGAEKYDVMPYTRREEPWRTYRADVSGESPVLMFDHGNPHKKALDIWQGIWEIMDAAQDDAGEHLSAGDVNGDDMMNAMQERFGYPIGRFTLEAWNRLGNRMKRVGDAKARAMMIEFLKEKGHDSIVYVNASEDVGTWSWMNLDPVKAEALGESFVAYRGTEPGLNWSDSHQEHGEMYWAGSPEYASIHTRGYRKRPGKGEVVQATLDIRNPYVTTHDIRQDEERMPSAAELAAQGYDGIHFEADEGFEPDQIGYEERANDVYVVFSPEQVKNARVVPTVLPESRLDELDLPAGDRAYHTTHHDVDMFRPLSHFGSAGAAGTIGQLDMANAASRGDDEVRPYRTYRAKIRAKQPILMVDVGWDHVTASDYWEGIDIANKIERGESSYDVESEGIVDRQGKLLVSYADMFNAMEEKFGYRVGHLVQEDWAHIGAMLERMEEAGNEKKAMREFVKYLKYLGHDSIAYINAGEDVGSWSWVNLHRVKAEGRKSFGELLGEAELVELNRPRGGKGYHITQHDVDEFNPLSHFGTAKAARDRKKATLGLWDIEGDDAPPLRTYRAEIKFKNPVLMWDDGGDHDALRTLNGLADAIRVGEYRGKKGYENASEVANYSVEDLMKLREVWMKRAARSPDAPSNEVSALMMTPKPQEEKRRRKELVDFLTSRGHDGIKYKNRVEARGSWSYINLKPVKAEGRRSFGELLDEAERLDELLARDVDELRQVTHKNDVEFWLESGGWKMVSGGEGGYSRVYEHPSSPWVMKLMYQDLPMQSDPYMRCGLQWLRFCQKNWQKNTALPKVGFIKSFDIGEEMNMYGEQHTTRGYIAAVERLEPLFDFDSEEGEQADLEHELMGAHEWLFNQSIGSSNSEDVEKILDVLQDPRWAHNCYEDLHPGNVMVRPMTDQLVINDPFEG